MNHLPIQDHHQMNHVCGVHMEMDINELNQLESDF